MPTTLRTRFARDEIRFTLKTIDPTIAKQLSLGLNARIPALYARLARMSDDEDDACRPPTLSALASSASGYRPSTKSVRCPGGGFRAPEGRHGNPCRGRGSGGRERCECERAAQTCRTIRNPPIVSDAR